MQVKVRKSRDGQWGFLESFSVYNYAGKGTITVTVGVSPEGKFVPCYAYRGEEFVPASEIDKTVGIDKYIKAKKPFYCKLADGFITTIKAGYDFKEKKFLKDKTSFNIYEINQLVKPQLANGKGIFTIDPILEYTQDIIDLMFSIAEDLCKCDGDREAFIKSRF